MNPSRGLITADGMASVDLNQVIGFQADLVANGEKGGIRSINAVTRTGTKVELERIPAGQKEKVSLAIGFYTLLAFGKAEKAGEGHPVNLVDSDTLAKAGILPREESDSDSPLRGLGGTSL